jgi:hypothetical protein
VFKLDEYEDREDPKPRLVNLLKKKLEKSRKLVAETKKRLKELNVLLREEQENQKKQKKNTNTNKVYDLSYLDSSSENEDSSDDEDEIIATANAELVYNQSTSSSTTVNNK